MTANTARMAKTTRPPIAPSMVETRNAQMKEMNTPTCQNTWVVETSCAATLSFGASWETMVMEIGRSAPEATPAMIRPMSSTVKSGANTQMAAPMAYSRLIQLNTSTRPILSARRPPNSDPNAMAKVRMPESRPTWVVSRPRPFCQTVMVADRPTMMPDPSMEPMPAATASGMYPPIPSFF